MLLFFFSPAPFLGGGLFVMARGWEVKAKKDKLWRKIRTCEKKRRRMRLKVELFGG